MMSDCFRRLVVVTAVVLLCWVEAQAGITNYVSVLSGDDSYDGLTWLAAKKTIQAAVNAASSGDTVLVSNGVYYLSSEIVISKAVTLRGFGGPVETIIDGSNACRCVKMAHSGAVIDGFSIRNGWSTERGAGVEGNPGGVLSNCRIYNNVSTNAVRSYFNPGGGIYFRGGTIQDCQVYSNSTSSGNGGGGVKLEQSAAMMRCEVYGNRSVGSGGGTRADNPATITDCTIHDNSADYGGGANVGAVYSRCQIYRNNPGGVWLAGGTLQDCQIYSNAAEGVWIQSGGTLRNCLVLNNIGDGIGLGNKNTTVENCTITGNSNGVSVASGIFATNVFRNVILYGNSAGSGGMDYVCASNAVFGCDFSRVNPIPSNGVGNIGDDPLFVNASLFDFRLQDGSHCINAGTNLIWMKTATDFEGRPRILKSRVDMGAYESGIIRYVSKDSVSNGPGTAWSNAFHTIQAAIDVALDHTVLVSNGVYYLSTEIAIFEGVTLQGLGGPSQTIIDGSNACRCVNISHAGAVIDGFSIRNGFSAQGGVGVFGLPGGVLRDCHVYGNVSSNASNGAGNTGGGIFFQGGTVEQCEIYSNSTTTGNGGGGVYLNQSGTVTRCNIYGNYSYGDGSGVRCNEGGVVEDCSIHDNAGKTGARISGGAGTFLRCRIFNNVGGAKFAGGIVRNCLIYGNSGSEFGGGVKLYALEQTTLENCTITGNRVTDSGGGVFVYGGDNGTGSPGSNIIRNVIVYGNFAQSNGMEYACASGVVFAADFSCVTPPPATGTGNIDADPLFVDAANGDLRLSVGSPCIDKGTNLAWMATSTDIGGKPRIFNGRADMGADEANILHVWTTSPADGPGTQWSNAFHTIQGAVDASVDLGMVLVTNGAYILANQIGITKGVRLRSTGGSGVTTVDGNGAAGCLSITHPQAVVEGFTITRGLNMESELGGGVYMSAGTLKDCTIVSNSAGFRGGGVHLDYGGMVSNCTIQGNSSEEGAGIYFTYGGVVRGSRIIGNTATGRGGGMRFEGGGLLEGSTVIGNSGAMGGGSAMRFDFIGGVATNCVITRNTSTDGGGVIRFSGGGSLYGCTISNNFSSGETVFQDSGNAAGTAVNCQIIGNVSDSGPGGCKYMTDCTIALNQATNGSGGGLSLRAGYVAAGCLIISNSASDGGGGVEMGEGASLLNCTSLWNTASWGAGVNCWGGNNRISGCVIANNETMSNCGGGVACGLGDTVVDSIIASNSAPNGGGIWFNEGGVASNCLIHGNTADYSGGVGCYLGGAVQNCSIRDNSASQSGGGVMLNEGGQALNCLITDNKSSFGGSGVDCSRGGEVLNCTICDNVGFMGGVGVFLNEGGTVRNSILQNNSDWSYNGGGWTMEYSCYSMMGPSSPGPGNITDDPQFVDAFGGDFRLATNSPCIDKGTNADWMVGATDLEGKPRILQSTVDMGAFEAILPAWDTDGDLIPDWWTWKYFGHLTGMPDDHSMATNCADGTGRDNLYKYVADLDPTNPLSVFTVDAVSNCPSGRFVRFAGSPDRVYTLNWTTNLVSGSWTNVPDQTRVSGSGPGTSLSDTNADAQRFYRLDVRMP